MLEFFKQFPEIVALMSEKSDGSMKIIDGEMIEKQNRNNRAVFFQKKGIEKDSVIIAGLVHGSEVKIIDSDKTKIIARTDGLVTDKKEIYLAVTVADCVPIFFYEKQRGIVGLAHGGWNGILRNITKNLVEKILQIGGSVENLHVALGPAIGECHFEIKEDIVEKFATYSEFIFRKNGKIFVDLAGIIQRQLLEIGVKKQNIKTDPTCTFCSQKLFSFRRDKPATVEAMVALIGLSS